MAQDTRKKIELLLFSLRCRTQIVSQPAGFSVVASTNSVTGIIITMCSPPTLLFEIPVQSVLLFLRDLVIGLSGRGIFMGELVPLFFLKRRRRLLIQGRH